MAWWDFIKELRQNEEDERARRTEGGTRNRIFGFLDDTLDVATGARDFAYERGADVVGGVAGIGRAITTQPAMKIGQSVQEAQTDFRPKMYDELLAISEADREKIANDPNDNRSIVLNRFKKQYGDLKDETIKKRKEGVNTEIAQKKEPFKPKTATEKAVFGNEDLVSYQRDFGIGKEKTGGNIAGGAAYAVGIGLLDSPFSLGADDVVKQVGKKGIKKLSEASTEEAVQQALKGKVASDVIADVAPRIADETDEKVISDILRQGVKARSVTTPTSGVDEFVDAAIPKVNKPLISKKPSSYGTDADEILGLMKSSTEIDKMKPGGGFKEKAYQQFFDKLSPMNKLVKQAEGQMGRKLTTEENPYELMRLYAGMPAQVKQRVAQVTDALEQSGNDDAVRIIGMSRRVLGRPDISSTFSPEKATKAMAQLRTKIGDEAFTKANAAVDTIVEYNETLLRELGESGVIAPDAVEEIIKQNPDYFSRMQVVNKMLEKADRDLFKSGQTFNLSKQNVVQAMKGMKEGSEILDPIESVVKATDLTMRTIAKNKIWNSMNDLADEVPDLIQRVRDPDDVAARMSLSVDNKELRPIRNKLDRMLKTRNRQVRSLQSQIGKLEKQGDMVADRGAKNMATALDSTAAKDTKTFLDDLISAPRTEINKLRRMAGTRDANLTKLLDDIDVIRAEYDEVAQTIKSNADEARSLADLNTPEGFDTIAGFKNGVGGRLAIPKEIADTYKGLTPEQASYLTKLVGGVNRVMKESVTSLSLPFAFIRNPIRDFKALSTNSQNIDPNVLKITRAWTKGFASALKQDEMYDRWIASGGGGAGIYSNVESAEEIARGVKRKVNGLEINSPADFAREARRVLGTPFRAVQKAGATLEAAPRLAEFTAAVEKGASDQSAAFAARNVTVDFNQSGTVGQIMNYYIPFLNARLQGNKKLLEAAKRDPARFANIYTTLTAAPIVATAALNSQFPEVLEQIDQQTKDNNFVIIFGDGQDEEGNFTQVMKIPKGDMDKIFGNPLENFTNYVAKNDTKGFGQVAREFVGAISPVDMVKDGNFNLSRTAGGVLPVAAKVPIEQATNHNLYFDSPIVPESMKDLPNSEQVKEDTNPVAKLLAGLTGGSPIKAEQAIRSTTGNLITSNPIEELGKTVAGARGNAPTNEFYSIRERVAKNRASASNAINEAISDGDIARAREIANSYNEYLVEQYTPWADRYGEYMTEDLEESYKGLKLNLSRSSIRQRRKTQLEKAERR